MSPGGGIITNLPLSSSYRTGPDGRSEGNASRSATVRGRRSSLMAFLLLHLGPLRVPIGRLLEHAGNPQQFLFLKGRRLNLQADRQAAFGEAARDADPR